VYVFIWRSSEAWHSKRPLLVEAVKSLLDEQNFGVRKALSEVHCLGLIALMVPKLFIKQHNLFLIHNYAALVAVDCSNGLTLLFGWSICGVVH
jgi:hypothetical protein